MTLPVWPASLPKPNRQGYQAQQQDPRLRKSGDAGPPGYRRRWSSVSKSVSLVIDVPRSEKAVFDQFYNVATSHGGKPFWMPDPVTDGWPMLTGGGIPILASDGSPILLAASWLCLFGQPTPTETIQGVRFIIGFSVEVMP
jgi:hypothetical protein